MIDPDEAKRIKKNLILHDIYYHPIGYYFNLKSLLKVFKASDIYKKEGYQFHLSECKNFLENQESYQINKTSSKYISKASYGRIMHHNYVYQCDILFLTHNYYRSKKYKAVFNIIDYAFRYKISVPLKSKKSFKVAKIFRKVYGNRNNLLV